MARPRPAAAVLVVSSALLFTSALLLVGAGSRADQEAASSFGDRQAILAAESGQPLAAPPSTPAAGDAQAARGPDRIESQAAYEREPARLRIPAIGVDARIIPVGLDADGGVLVPEDIERAGWYRLGAAPGDAAGSAVLVGHRDGAGGAWGVFIEMDAIARGDEVQVTDRLGRTRTFRVAARELVPRSEFPVEAPDLFAPEGPPRLTLITCGGQYDRNAGGYQANIVVTAVPV